jgi:hypothetical protein
MISFFGGKQFLRAATHLTLILTLAAFAPLCLAESANVVPGANPNLDKHARKIQRELSHFKQGSYVHLTFVDGSGRTVAVDTLQDTSFSAINAETNKPETHDYDVIAHVSRDKGYIGEGSEERVHHVRLWVPITAALVAGAAATAFVVR